MHREDGLSDPHASCCDYTVVILLHDLGRDVEIPDHDRSSDGDAVRVRFGVRAIKSRYRDAAVKAGVDAFYRVPVIWRG